ncbi:MAG: sensor histidine kinase [Bacteroidia bacterium]|nr:sensor histidine kinase [Bacteroidia bacterium]MCF8425805.1 sensor histidine kinase [Bacteroidia bacterium]MCF8447838.1 sensor histidine kinase [Bacteroidia bacterium]
MKKAVLFLFFGFISQFIFGSNQDLALQLEKAKKLKIAFKLEEAKQLLLEGLESAKLEGNEAMKAKFQLALADQLLSMNQVDSIDFYYENAVKIFETIGEKGNLIRAKTGLLELQRRTNPGSTMDQYLLLLKEARALGDREVYYFVMDKLITLNYAMENYEDAIAMNRECIQYYESTRDSLALAIKIKGLGNLYFSNGGDSAMFYFKKSLQYFERLNSYSNMVFTHQSIGWLLYLKGENDLAWKNLVKADSMDNLYQIRSAQLPFVMSLVLFKKGKVQEAIAMARKSYDMALKAKQLFICIQCADALTGYYKSLNIIDSALHYNELSKLINDSIRSQRDYRNAAKMQAKMEYDREVFQKELIQKEEIRREKLIRNFSLGGFVLVVIFLVAGWFAFKNNQKKSVLISRQNDEKTILLQEIHHRVKNNLSVVSGILDLQQRGIKDHLIQSVFTDAKLRINSMVLVHQNLYEQEDFTKIDTQNYFQNLANTIYKAYKKNDLEIEIEVNCKDVSITIDTLIPLALISNELLTNSFKYAFLGKSTGKILIHLKEQDNGYCFTYSDTGIGISNEDKLPTKVGLGSRLVEGLCKQLKGVFIRENQGEGLKYTFTFEGLGKNEKA